MQIRPHLGFLKILPIGIAIMTGALSIVREVASLYGIGDNNPSWNKQLFWACVWIAFVLSAIVAWYLKNQELLTEKARQTFPDFAGKIEECFLQEDTLPRRV